MGPCFPREDRRTRCNSGSRIWECKTNSVSSSHIPKSRRDAETENRLFKVTLWALQRGRVSGAKSSGPREGKLTTTARTEALLDVGAHGRLPNPSSPHPYNLNIHVIYALIQYSYCVLKNKLKHRGKNSPEITHPGQNPWQLNLCSTAH